MEIYKSFSFEAAHFLPNVPQGHKCRNMHGHSYKVIVFLKGKLDAHVGWVIDFAEIKAKVNPLIKFLDHKILNEIEGLENPTAEHLTIWIWNKLKAELPQISKIELKETETSGCVYQGEFD